MGLWYTPLNSDSDINALELNNRLTELSEAIDDLLDGTTPQTPTITDFTNAGHDHEDAAGGGQLTVDAISSGAATDGQVATADGAGNVAWETPVENFVDLGDTFNDYTGLGGQYLRVNAGATAIEASALNAPDIDEKTQNEVGNHTTTSTSFVNVNAVRLALTLTVQDGSRGIEVAFFGTCHNATAGSGIFLNVAIDGTPVVGDDGMVTEYFESGASVRIAGFARYIPLSPGTYNVTLQWKVTGGTGVMYAGAGTSGADVHPQLYGKEVI